MCEKCNKIDNNICNCNCKNYEIIYNVWVKKWNCKNCKCEINNKLIENILGKTRDKINLLRISTSKFLWDIEKELPESEMQKQLDEKLKKVVKVFSFAVKDFKEQLKNANEYEKIIIICDINIYAQTVQNEVEKLFKSD